jgi:hypothetical protein
LILALFDVVVRQGAGLCEEDQIRIRNQTSAASTPRRGRKSRRTAFRCIFCAERLRSRECSVTRFTAVRRARAGRHEDLRRKRWGGRLNAVQDRHLVVGVDVDAFSRQIFQHSTKPGAKSRGRASIQSLTIAGGKNLPASISVAFSRNSPSYDPR